MKNLSRSQGLKPREAAALLDCVELLSDSVDELQRSVEEMGRRGGSKNDIQTWVSAALTDHDTCMDGFAGKAVNGNVKTVVRRHILKVAHLTSNALALINNYAGTPPQLNYANEIQTSPKLLASTALSVSLSATRSSLEIMKNLSTSPELKPREATAMRDCVELLGDSVDELQRSMEELGHSGGSNIEFQINDIQTWVSAALTNADTCTDGFAGKAMNGNVKTVVRRNIPKVAHLTSNALALINNYAGTPPQLK
ncbi:hypothetical protein F0562_012787 [Nyssa sinensis]|uniref:pectinesterase n=1 Tax=Nyssa sinensis TaxID=561372 RepID=A0A5J4ZV40_9ASTE|nr:hypothetical protein F0562_012787 [Nyssa sinensis]